MFNYDRGYCDVCYSLRFLSAKSSERMKICIFRKIPGLDVNPTEQGLGSTSHDKGTAGKR